MAFACCALAYSPPTMAGLDFYPCFSACSSWNCHPQLVVVSSASRSMSIELLDPDGGHLENEKLLWADLDSWEKRLEKRGPRLQLRPTDSEQKSTRDAFLLNNQNKALWLDSRLATMDVDAAHQQDGALSDGLCDEVCRLCDEGHLDRALDVLLRIDFQGSVSSENVCRSFLNACNKRKALNQAKRVREHLVRHGLASTSFLGEFLVLTLAKCGGFEDALQVFHTLPHRTVFSWTAVISGYTDNGKGQEALNLYKCMREEGVEPNGYTFVSLLKACGTLAEKEKAVVVEGRSTKVMSLEIGQALHADVRRRGFDSHVFAGSALVSMYSKCRSIFEAEKVFNGLSQRDVVLWNAMLSAYVEQGEGGKALQLYRQMQEEGMTPNDRTFVIALQACCTLAEKEEPLLVVERLTKVTSLEIGQALHAETQRNGSDSYMFVGSTLVSMYGKCGRIEEAEKVFKGLSQRDVVSWNAMLSAYVEQDGGEKALQLYRQMQEEGVNPDGQTFLITLQACCMHAEKEEAVVVKGRLIRVMSLKMGQAVHADALRKGFDLDVFVGSSLVSMYGKCGSIVEAEDVFNGLTQHDVVSWTAMLAAYVEQGEGDKGLQLYRQMQKEGVNPDERTFVIAIQACCAVAEKEEAVVIEGQAIKVMSLEVGQALHVDALRKGFDLDVFVGSTLVNMYGKCGSIVEAENVFNGLPRQDCVSWTAMLSAYVEQGEGEKALKLYWQMQEEGAALDDTTLVCVLQACSETGSLEICKLIHLTVVAVRYDPSLLLANTLIHTYGSCASMMDAQAVFEALPRPDVVSWTALISGYAREGNCEASLHNFEEMQQAGIKPNGVTFLSLLSACSHAGLVDKGVEYYESLSRHYGITPEIEHHIGLVDILGRAGDFTRVEDMLSAPTQSGLTTWLCLLGSCQKHGNVELGKQAFDWAVHLGPKKAAAYVLMSNIYADAWLQDCK